MCLLYFEVNENKEDVQSITTGPSCVLNIFNMCHTKHFHLRFSQTSFSITCFKVKNYFVVTWKAKKRYERKAITFSIKENKENQRALCKFMALKWTSRTDKAKVTRSTNELSPPCKSLPSLIKVKNISSSKPVTSSVPSSQ